VSIWEDHIITIVWQYKIQIIDHLDSDCDKDDINDSKNITDTKKYREKNEVILEYMEYDGFGSYIPINRENLYLFWSSLRTNKKLTINLIIHNK